MALLRSRRRIAAPTQNTPCKQKLYRYKYDAAHPESPAKLVVEGESFSGDGDREPDGFENKKATSCKGEEDQDGAEQQP